MTTSLCSKFPSLRPGAFSPLLKTCCNKIRQNTEDVQDNVTSCSSKIQHIQQNCSSKCRKEMMKLHDGLCLLGDTLGTVGAATMIAKTATDANALSTLNKLSSLETACGIAMGASSCVDVAALGVQLFTGAMFYEVDAQTGNFVLQTKTVQLEDGTHRVVPSRVLRSPLCIAGKITRLASKAIGSVVFADELKLVSLGKRAATLGGVASCLSAVSSACCAADDAVDIVSLVRSPTGDLSTEELTEHRQTLRMKFFALLCNLVDLVTEGVCLCLSFVPALLGSHALLIVGIFLLLSAVFNFVRDFVGF